MLPWAAGSVIAAAVAAIGAALLLWPTRHTAGEPWSDEPWLHGVATSPWLVPSLIVLVTLSSAVVVRIRVRSTVAGTAWVDAATLICIVLLPPGLVAAVVLVGVLLGKLLIRVAPYKAAFNASKDALAATAGVAVAQALQLAPGHDQAPWNPLILVLVAMTITLVEFAVGAPVLSLVSGVPWWRLHRDDADIKAAFFAGKLLVAVASLAVLAQDLRAVAAVPAAVLCLHLLFVSRVRGRADRNAARLLAATTESLSGPDVRVVLTTAAGDAVRLFSAEEAEVFLPDGPDGPLLARGDLTGSVWSGDPGQAPGHGWPRSTHVVTAPLLGDGRRHGEVRLRYDNMVSLSDRELLTLRTFASAVGTAARGAQVCTQVRRGADDQARLDPLTGLANRRRFLELTEAALAEPGLTAVLVIDLGLFREVTDTLGFLAGDRLLAEVGGRLAAAAGLGELAARLDGDTFAVLLAGAGSTPAAWERSVELVMGLDAPVELPGSPGVRVAVAACAGLAIATSRAVLTAAPSAPGAGAAIPGQGRPDTASGSGGPAAAAGGPAAGAAAAVAELLRRADVARQEARRNGPRVVRYAPSHDPADVATLMLGGDLARALARQEIVVRFQPIVDLASGMMIGVEALSRWQHPDLGELDPHQFLSAVQRADQVAGFDAAVLDQALRAQALLRAAGLRVPVAVNAGARSLLDQRFVELVRARLAQHGASGADLVVELTESITLAELDQVADLLAQLRATGVRLALDDFGTRSSALAMVAQVPSADLKIDMVFVSQMADVPEARAVVRSTVELGRSLGRLVVAEGIEREDQRQALHELGCPAGQGHLFGRAMPIDELLRRAEPGVDGVPGRLAPPLHDGQAGRRAAEAGH